MIKKISAKARNQKEFVAPMLSILLVPKRKQHQCITPGCKDEKHVSYQCALGGQCRMKIDQKLHQSVPFFARWTDGEDIICAFCTRAYANHLFLAASDAFYYLHSLEPHTDFYVNLSVPATGPKICCCNPLCSVKEGDFQVQGLSCLTPSTAWHAYCLGCMPTHFSDTSVCENCGFDLESLSVEYCQLLF